MLTQRILFVDDEAAGRRVARFNLEAAGYEVDEASTGEEALEMFSPERHDAVVTDIRMPGMSGMKVVEVLRQRAPNIPVLVITAFASIDTAVAAMKLGACDFVVKPFSKDQLLLALEKALEHQRVLRENRQLRLKLKGVERPLVYGSTTMSTVLSVVERIAPSDAPVLITGETGTGKELIARRIHIESARREEPFIAINCAALPAELLEAELFGHTKGAFTRAAKERLGHFRRANRGTLFLDEVVELTPPLQAKLLRVLQERVMHVLGSDSPVPIDVRVVSATNKKMEELLRTNSFREDLYYRLNVVHVDMPPLRERKDDIPLLVEHFLDTYGDGRELSVPLELMRILETYDWPGNVRELENACQRMVLLSRGVEATVEDLPPQILIATNSADKVTVSNLIELPEVGLSLLDLEKDIILRVLEQKKWNVSQSASYLSVPRHVLAYRMEKYGIERKK
jgi:two-component system NtrC family response regulator